tara:strand:+ start:6792 stop:7223 length:432 start_codon:yes stop_codon:yes gene_type:complete
MLANFPGYDRLKKVKQLSEDQWVCCCPAHDDSSPSFYIRRGRDRWLVHCHAGCSYEEICEALEIKTHEMFFNKSYNGRSDTDLELERTIVFIHENSITKPSESDYERYVTAKLRVSRAGMDMPTSKSQKTLGLSKSSVSENLD